MSVEFTWNMEKKQSSILPHSLKHEELLKQDSKAEEQIFFQLKQENTHDPTQPGKSPLMYQEIVDQSKTAKYT